MNRLQQQVASMVALEAQIESTLVAIIERGVAHPGADALLKRIRATAEEQHIALDARLRAIDGGGSGPLSVPALGDLTRADDNGSGSPVSFALHTVQTMLNHAVFGYTILQPLTHRYLDSKAGGGENTGDISIQHTNAYAAASQEINQLIHDVVLWELGQADDECRCICPSCSLGVCLCSVSSRTILNNAWADTVPASEDGILVQLPRTGSAALTGGLQAGDVVLAADGQAIHSAADLQGVVREHESGEEIMLQVQRENAGTLDVVVTQP